MAKKKFVPLDTDLEFELLGKYMTYYIDKLEERYLHGKKIKPNTFEEWKGKIKPKTTKSKKKVVSKSK